MRATVEYVAVTLLALALTAALVYPMVQATSQSIINSAHCIDQPQFCGR